MHIACMYLHTGLLAITTGWVSNSSFDNKGYHSPREVYLSFPRGLRGKKQSRNSDCAGSRIPGYRTRFTCMVNDCAHQTSWIWWIAVFNGCIRRQLINSPGCTDCSNMSGLCHLTNYIRMGKWVWMKGTYTQALDLLCLLSTCTGRTRPDNKLSTLRMQKKSDTRENLQFTNYWNGKMLPGVERGTEAVPSNVVGPAIALLLALNSDIPLFSCLFIVQHIIMFSEHLLCPMHYSLYRGHSSKCCWGLTFC